MSKAALDRLLALLVGLILLTGVLTWRAGSPDTFWLYAVHGVLSAVLLCGSVLKLRRSLPRAWHGRRWREPAIALPLALATLGALVIGFAWVAGGRYVEFGPWTVLGWHGILGWALLVLVVAHLLVRRRWRVLNPRNLSIGKPLSRRSLVAGGALGIAGALSLPNDRCRRLLTDFRQVALRRRIRQRRARNVNAVPAGGGQIPGR